MKGKTCKSLEQLYPPSEPCSCALCTAYCRRPGWWTVEEATRAVAAGHAARMMLEVAPEMTFAVLSPAFYGCEGGLALQEYAGNGCNFLQNGLCQLHGTGLEPLECRFCHHLRRGLGAQCHAALEEDWRTPAGQALVKAWLERILTTEIADQKRKISLTAAL